MPVGIVGLRHWTIVPGDDQRGRDRACPRARGGDRLDGPAGWLRGDRPVRDDRARGGHGRLARTPAKATIAVAGLGGASERVGSVDRRPAGAAAGGGGSTYARSAFGGRDGRRDGNRRRRGGQRPGDPAGHLQLPGSHRGVGGPARWRTGRRERLVLPAIGRPPAAGRAGQRHVRQPDHELERASPLCEEQWLLRLHLQLRRPLRRPDRLLRPGSRLCGRA